jgi:CCR4-NOT transcriptional regulation complex NOT5 subunit
MKKEIKKLQRVRDFFRQTQNNPDIRDKTKFIEAKKRIEQVS